MNAAVKEMLGFNPSNDYKQLISKGAKVIDVRSHGEFAAGHLKDAMNIPFEELPYKLATMDRNLNYIVCCANGFRSASAHRTMLDHGFTKVINGGSWIELSHELV